MSHIVIHDDASGVTHYDQFTDLASAINHVEALRNHDGVDRARLFELQEVAYEMKAYFKVELGTPELKAGEPVVETVAPPEILPTAAETEMVFETASEPIEASASISTLIDDPLDAFDEPRLTGAGGDGRRGLFGR